MKSIQELDDDEFATVVREAVALRDAPDAMIRAAIALWPAPSAVGIAAQGVAKRIASAVRAVLSFDSWALAPSALAVRSMPSQTRHLLFSAEGRDIDLRIRPSPSGFQIAGQVLGPDEAGTIELRGATDDEAGAPRYRAALDDLGEFRLDGIIAGRYLATLELGDGVVALPAVDVGDRTS